MSRITMFGDSALLAPLWMLLLVWSATFDRRLALRWATVVGCAMLILVASKLFYASTGIALEGGRFRVISGHTALSFSVWPVFAFLVFQARPRAAYLAVAIAVIFSGLVGYSRVQIGAHTPLEVVAGLLLGGGVSGTFFIFWARSHHRSLGYLRWPFIASSTLLISICYGYQAPVDKWIGFVGQWISVP